ncbi:Elongator subunit elp2 [Physocladia obscura]|uniref:Elongator complex protein 2 n=1 Tax=Physocladia obscura TaxID=109957 RepID=A0AAD5XHK3_9FUNG|nr:Elongator subunit elp2 [Physocladia obscura]
MQFVSATCNRAPQTNDVAYNLAGGEIVAFGAHNSVALAKVRCGSGEGAEIIATLHGHTGLVSCVRFLRRNNSGNNKTNTLPVEVALVSASADTSLRIWKPYISTPIRNAKSKQKKKPTNTAATEWRCSAVLTGHSAPVSALAVAHARVFPTSTSDLIISAATDATVRIWRRSPSSNHSTFEDHVECIQILPTGPRYSLSAALSFLPNSNVPILFLAGCDNLISVYLSNDKNLQFSKILALQGHTDWIRDLEVATFTKLNTDVSSTNFGYSEGDLMLASASQDKYVRLWKVSESGPDSTKNLSSDSDGRTVILKGGSTEFNDAIEMLETLVGEDGEGGIQLSTKAHIIEVAVGDVKRKYTIMFDALLIGHEDWVHSVAWAPPVVKNNVYIQKLELVSASADKCVTVWKPDSGHVWTVDSRLGEVGGNSFGFYGARFGFNSKWILAHGYHGALQIWESLGVQDGQEVWDARVGLSGHYMAVEDIAWNETGDFLISTSLDQTSRLWGEWKRNGKSTWHEIARPQIHGYDLHCLAMIHKYGFVSGADEKIIRVFEASRTFLESLKNISGIEETGEVLDRLPVGAAVPALGLSNKAILSGAPLDTNAELVFTPLAPETVQRPPFEQYLMQHTLWPEVNKLYGHGYELISIAASHNGKFVASSSKAAISEHAVVRVWSTETWKEAHKPLTSHSLTVTGIEFSHDDTHLLTCGRDRMWSLFKLDDEDNTYKPLVNNVSHGRIIWGCSWSHDDKYFATGSRDKTIKVWRLSAATSSPNCALEIKAESSVTAISFAPWSHNPSSMQYVIAAGHEGGRILFHIFSENSDNGSLVLAVGSGSCITAENCPGGTIKRLAWRPKINGGKVGSRVVAAASEDHSVRIYTI